MFEKPKKFNEYFHLSVCEAPARVASCCLFAFAYRSSWWCGSQLGGAHGEIPKQPKTRKNNKKLIKKAKKNLEKIKTMNNKEKLRKHKIKIFHVDML